CTISLGKRKELFTASARGLTNLRKQKKNNPVDGANVAGEDEGKEGDMDRLPLCVVSGDSVSLSVSEHRGFKERTSQPDAANMAVQTTVNVCLSSCCH
ncbi:uncharacterized, partial [Tachysurus ichikawai]